MGGNQLTANSVTPLENLWQNSGKPPSVLQKSPLWVHTGLGNGRIPAQVDRSLLKIPWRP